MSELSRTDYCVNLTVIVTSHVAVSQFKNIQFWKTDFSLFSELNQNLSDQATVRVKTSNPILIIES